MACRLITRGAVFVILLVAVRLSLSAQDAARFSVNFTVSLTEPDPKTTSNDSSGVVVWLSPVEKHTSPTPPVKHFRITQKDKKFHPNFIVFPRGSTVDFPNLDPWFHNVFSQFRGKRFDLGLYQAGETRSVTFDKAGVSYLFCNIHPQMTAILVAVDSDYFAVSDKAGHLQIPNVPPGRYEVHAWHRDATPESMKAAERIIAVESGAPLESIKLTRKPFNPVHKNKYGKDYEGTPLDPQY